MLEKIAGKLGFVPKEKVNELEKKVNILVRRQNSRARKAEVIDTEVLAKAVIKSSSWSRLFSIAQEWKLFGNEVTRPYEQVSSVYKAIKAIADNVPQADLKFRDKKSKKDIEGDELIELFEKPNPYMTEADFIQAWVGFLCLCGEAMITKETAIGQMTGARKLPAELWAFNPIDFQEITAGRMITGWRYNKEQIIFKPEDVIFIKDFNPYSLFRGMRPTKPIEKIIDIDWQSLIFNKAFFDNNATPGTVLQTDQELNDTIIERTKKYWESQFKGASNAHKVAVLEAGLKAETLGSTHKDMEFIEQKKFTREEILGIWRAPKALFNITEDLNYATFIGQMKIFWSYSIMPAMKKIQAAINKDIVSDYNPKIEAYFDYSNVVAYQEDFKEKVDTATKLSTIGFTRNEINTRLELGFDEAPWGDVWWASFGLVPITSAEKQEEDLPDDGTGKSLFEQKKTALWKGFIVKQGNLEQKMSGAISKYFLEQRKEALRALYELGAQGFKIDWEEQNKKLKEKAEKFIYLGIKEGIDFGRVILGKKSLSDDQLEAKIRAFLFSRVDKITSINNTIKKQIGIVLSEGITEGQSIDQIANNIRDVYNMASSRSLMIARTETVGAVNGGSELYYESEGVSEKEWLTARDELVRESHQRLEGESVNVGKSFSNGLDYPGDQKGGPEEVINCRCTILPVVK